MQLGADANELPDGSKGLVRILTVFRQNGGVGGHTVNGIVMVDLLDPLDISIVYQQNHGANLSFSRSR